MSPLSLNFTIRPRHWVGASVAILALEYLTGPFIQFPILFTLPVVLAAAGAGRAWGLALAVGLPLVHLSFFALWRSPTPWRLILADTAIDVGVLAFFALLVDRIVRQARALRVLQGMLPICGFCKRIRVAPGEWQQLERYISDHSEASFSHTFCPECAERHYGTALDR